MLGRFICPAARLEELAECLPQDFARSGCWELSVLVGDGSGPEVALDALAGQARAIAVLESRFPGQIRVAALESPLPAVAAADPEAYLTPWTAALTGHGLIGRELYLEVPAGADPALDAGVLAAIGRLRAAGKDALGPVGAKFRCGGVTVDAFPSTGRLAGIITTCRDLRLPLKCTAGLHHPVRHRSREPDVMMHGFLNVFGAGLLAVALDAGPDVVRGCLEETDPAAFGFGPDGFRWRDLAVSTAEIGAARAGMLCGFGSCSFTEPREDLQQLGLLP